MNLLPNDLIFLIYEFSHNKALKIINKRFYKYTRKRKQLFIKNFKNKEIGFKYKLIRWKHFFNENYSYRPSMYFEKSQTFILNCKNIGINIGTITNNKIVPSKEIEKILIPESKVCGNSVYNLRGYYYYWTFVYIKTADKELFNEYLLLF